MTEEQTELETLPDPKEALAAILLKRLPDFTNQELADVIEVPVKYWPTNPHSHTMKDVKAELKRRLEVSKPTEQDLLKLALEIAILRHLVGYGPGVFPELHLIPKHVQNAAITKKSADFHAMRKAFLEPT